MIKRVLTIVGLVGAIVMTLNFTLLAVTCWIKAHDPMIIRTGATQDWNSLLGVAIVAALLTLSVVFWLVSRLRKKSKPPVDTHF